MNRRQALRAIRLAGPYHVSSCGDGSLIVAPKWAVDEKAKCDECGKPWGPGLFTRMALAAAVELLLTDAVAKKGKVRR